MKEINEIKSIEIVLSHDGDSFIFKINGEVSEDGYNIKTTKANARHAARALTRAAMNFWDKFDVAASMKKDEYD